MNFVGLFTDGKSATRHDVNVSLTPHGLMISGPTVAPLNWPYRALRLAEADGRHAPARITHDADDDARLVIADPDFMKVLLAQAPDLDPRKRRRWRTAAIVLGSLAAIAIVGGTLWFGLPLLAKPIAAVVPQAFQDRLGKQVIAFIAGNRKTCDDAAGVRALERLTDRLESGLQRPPPMTVHVIDSPMVNALAAPGGHIVVFDGLLQKAEGPEEVAGVLAHEMGHVVHHHSMQALVRHYALSLIATVLLGNDKMLGSAGALLIQFAYSRDAEAEADATAVAILDGAGLRSDGLSRFFARVEQDEKKDGAALWRYLRTHPPTGERIAALDGHAAQPKRPAGSAGAPVLSEADWAALKAICKKD
ncbi:MAG TPA: M48 family metallopeptidase [Alphaproteobacteria bacterium]|nr:M48 family metallopeptidase [Alphaproteobacteria bacterium]